MKTCEARGIQNHEVRVRLGSMITGSLRIPEGMLFQPADSSMNGTAIATGTRAM